MRKKKTENARSNIYKYIFNAEEAVSKREIAKALTYSMPTVHKHIFDLERTGLIQAGERKESTGGRPAMGYVAREDIKYAIGIAISANHLRMVATDIGRKEIAHKKIRLTSHDAGYLMEMLSKYIDVFIEENKLPEEKLLGIGITVPGVIDEKSGTIMFSPTLQLKKFPMDEIKKIKQCPVIIENDSTCAGYAEWISQSPSERKKNFAYLMLEEGVGGAIFVNGKPYYGSNNRSAEFGHMCIVPNGRMCNCGRKGCLEAYCSALRYSAELGITVEEFFEKVSAGEKESLILWEDVMEHLALAIDNIRLISDCDVIIGGFVTEFLEPYMEELKRRVSERSIFDDNADFLKKGKFQGRVGAYGAAWQLIEEFKMTI